jgi:hypothetical protein
MSDVVYLIGHGRVSNDAPVEMPEHMTMHWLGSLGDVSNGISYAFLAGELTAELNTSVPKDKIPEHFLCGEQADIDGVVDTKIKAFFDRQTAHPLNCPNPYVLYTRGKTNVSLTSIFQFLNMLSPSTDWDLYWTCCRGFIGKNNPLTSTYVKETGTVQRLVRTDPEVTPELKDKGHATLAADFNNIRLVAQSDRNVIAAQMRMETSPTPSQTKAIEHIMGQPLLDHQKTNRRDALQRFAASGSSGASDWSGTATTKTTALKARAKEV